MSTQERRASLLAELAAIDNQHEGDVDVTVCILSGSNWRTLNPVLESLVVQGVRLDVRTCVDSRVSQDDPTRGILQACTTWMPSRSEDAVRSFSFDGDIPFRDTLDNMVSHARRVMIEETETEWVFFLDADVLLDPGTLRSLLNIADGDNIGAWCIPYNHCVDHEQWGCTLMRTEVAKEVGFSGQDQCGCLNLKKDLKARGLEMVHVEGLSAQHLKRGQIRTVVMGG